MKNTISFQGELGSYSHQACLDLYPDHEVLPCATFESAIDSVNKGVSQLTMLPIENSTYGRVADIHSLLPLSGLTIIKEYFLKPGFGSNPLLNSFNINIKHIEALDFLLWKWKGELSREWYPYLFSLKHDLQLKLNILTSERLIKTQTIPLSEFVIKKLNKGELK